MCVLLWCVCVVAVLRWFVVLKFVVVVVLCVIGVGLCVCFGVLVLV